MATCSLDVLLQPAVKQYYRTQQCARVNGCGCVAQNHSTDVKIVCGFTYNKKKICLKNRKNFVTRNSSYLNTEEAGHQTRNDYMLHLRVSVTKHVGQKIN